MHALLLERAAEKPRGRSRTLIVKDGTVWMWPGVPLTVKLDGQTHPLPNDCVRFWITRLHGFEADPTSVERALSRAADQLTLEDRRAAKIELDRSGLDRLSPEGDMLMTVTAKRLGVPRVLMPVGLKSAPWGSGEVGKETHLFDSFAHAAIALEKAWNEDDHPRWPKHAPDGQGGRFSVANSGTGASGPTESVPGIGHNGGPPLDDRPRLPPELPPKRKLINAILKRLARWLVRKGLTRLIPILGEVLLVLDGASWIKDYMPYIQAYCEPRHSLDQLTEAANHPALGYDIHHIVEQTSARNDGFSDDQIESGDNRVRISTLKHWEITGWYNTKTDRYNGLTPRQYLRGKNWEERRRVGIQALIDSGVLKP